MSISHKVARSGNLAATTDEQAIFIGLDADGKLCVNHLTPDDLPAPIAELTDEQIDGLAPSPE